MKIIGVSIWLGAVVGMPLIGGTGYAQEPVPNAQAIEFFEKHVRPILADHCFSCHGNKKQKAGLRLDSRAGLLKGTDAGPVVVPGKPDQSALIRAIRYDGDVKMPPKGKLSAEAIDALTAWIKLGAPWPAASAAAAKSAADPIAEARKTHWAFRPVQKPPVPPVSGNESPETAVDAFILAKLAEKGMTPAPLADRRTLLRRATFDLTGLPPTPEEVDAFLADPSPDAFARVVDRLLASPAYGERWGRHWLDVARYADTKGYVFTAGRTFPYAYTYRDYVIRAFNEDLPYDRFVVEQLAADQLPLGDDKRALAAMGYLTLGRRFLNNEPDIIDDRIDVVTRGLLGLTVACARCHDHKFDPIPTKDYYSLYGVFASSQEPPEEPLLAAVKPTPAYRAFAKELESRQGKVNDYLSHKQGEYQDRARARAADTLLAASATRGETYPPLHADRGPSRFQVRRWQQFLNETRRQHHPVMAPWHAFAALPRKGFAAQAPAVAARVAANADPKHPVNPLVAQMFAGKPPASLREVAQRYDELLAWVDERWKQAVRRAKEQGTDPPTALSDPALEQIRQVLYAPSSPCTVAPRDAEQSLNQREREELARLRAAVDDWQATGPGAPPRGMVLVDAPTPVRPRVFLRGNSSNPGPEVPRQFLAVLSGDRRQPFAHGSGRLDLARAIASKDNPLAARVMVNRIWQHHFGKGLVTTPSDFGLRSDPPSHPELLDYLAATFMERGWSVKSLHRLIMLSRTYQQSSADNPDYARADPDNRLLWKMNRQRLEFEALRDSLLAVTGRLDRTLGGRAVDITKPPFTPRRSVYGFIDRQNLPGLFRTFDFANPDASSPKRHVTTVPKQALFLMNSPFVVEQARHLVRRPDISSQPEPEQRIDRLYRLLYGRQPEPEEVALGLQFVETAQGPGGAAGNGLGPWEKYAQVLLLANEFVFVD